MIGGKSAVDLGDLGVKDLKEAGDFLRSYGYDPNLAKDAKDLHSLFIEAIAFIEKQLMPDEWRAGNQPPDAVLKTSDARDLILMASAKERNASSAWACAILRVMHTIVHIHGSHKLLSHRQAKLEIVAAFEEHIHRLPDGTLWLGPPDQGIQLSRVEWKRQKSRESIILKLLHKPANVAETIFDLIGVRLVTKNLCDVLLAVKYIGQFYLINYANCNPTRARNTLIDLAAFEETSSRLFEMVANGALQPQQFEDLLNRTTPYPVRIASKTGNPHSSSFYRAIQLTCRHLIKSPHPLAILGSKLAELRRNPSINALHEPFLRDLSYLISSMEHGQQGGFFPFEVQLVDENNYIRNETGEASHNKYRQAQIKTARRRILAEVLSL